MPLFGSKFSLKKPPIRKSNSNISKESLELVSEDRVVHLKLGEHEFTFKDGEWISGADLHDTMYKSKQKLKKNLQGLEEENNLLKLKYEIMLNMLTEATAEKQNQHRDGNSKNENEFWKNLYLKLSLDGYD